MKANALYSKIPYFLILFFFAYLKNHLSHQSLSLNHLLVFSFELLGLTPLLALILLLQQPSVKQKLFALGLLIKKIIPLLIALPYSFLGSQRLIQVLDDRLQPLFKDQSLIPLILEPLQLLLLCFFFFMLYFSLIWCQKIRPGNINQRFAWLWDAFVLLSLGLPWVFVSYAAWEIFFSLYSIQGLWIFLGYLFSIYFYRAWINHFYDRRHQQDDMPLHKSQEKQRYLGSKGLILAQWLIAYLLLLISIFSFFQNSSIRQFAYQQSLVLKLLIDKSNQLSDQDQDGYGTIFGLDCDDQNPGINPAEIDWPQTKIKEDCSTLTEAERKAATYQINDLLPMPTESALQALGKTQPNLLLISIDTLRADHMQSYGYPMPTTPFLEEMSGFYWQIERAYSPSNATKYSLSSMLTGLPYRLIPFDQMGSNVKFSAETPTLFHTLKALGWHTQAHLPAFFKQDFLKEIQGHFDELIGYGASNEIKTINSTQMVQKTRLAIQERQKQEQAWALWLHLVDPHEPYLCFDPKLTMSCYDQEILRVDGFLKQIITPSLLQNTIVIITSDHGEEFDEHGNRFHHHQLFEESIKVPLIIFHPALALTASMPAIKKTLPIRFSLHNLYPLIMKLLTDAPLSSSVNTTQLQGSLIDPSTYLTGGNLNKKTGISSEHEVSDLKQSQNNIVKKQLNINELITLAKDKKSNIFQELILNINSKIFSNLNQDIFSEHFEDLDQPRNRKISLIVDEFKAIFDIKKQELFLFNLKKDPFEKQDLSQYYPKNILQIKSKMQNYLQRELEQQLQQIKRDKVIQIKTQNKAWITEQSFKNWKPYDKAIDIDQGMMLLGSKLEQIENLQDEPGSAQYILKLYWYKTGDQPLDDYWIEIAWRNQSKQKLIFKTNKTRPVSGLYPTFLWHQDELIEDAYYFKTKTTKTLEKSSDLEVRLSIQKNQKPKDLKVITLPSL